MKFDVYYMRPDYFATYIHGDVLPTVTGLAETHNHIRTIEAEDLDGVYYNMQAEVWSPNGEARIVIDTWGLRHTSMSVGDVTRIVGTDRYYAVAPAGFTQLEA